MCGVDPRAVGPAGGERLRGARIARMDDGPPIAYLVLEKDVPVYASQGGLVGTVDHVIAAPELDIFHGIVIRVGNARRFVSADQVASLHEHGVDLSIDERQAAALPEPDGSEAGVNPSGWKHLLGRMGGASGRS